MPYAGVILENGYYPDGTIGTYFTKTFPIAGAPGVPPDVVIYRDNLTITVSGTATQNEDYEISPGHIVDAFFVSLSTPFQPDGEVEPIETIEVTFKGSLEYFISAVGGGVFFNNKEGYIQTVNIDTTYTFDIDSAPVQTSEGILDYDYGGLGGDDVAFNVLADFEDGPGEILRIQPYVERVPSSNLNSYEFLDNGVRYFGRHGQWVLLKNGDVIVEEWSGDPYASEFFSFFVLDENGTDVLASATISTATLTMDAPEKVRLVEGQEGLEVLFTLAEARETDVEVTVTLEPSGFGEDLRVAGGIIQAGQLSGSFLLVDPLRDDSLEDIETGTISVSAISGGESLLISRDGVTASRQEVEIELNDRIPEGLEPVEVKNGLEEGKIALESLSNFTQFSLLLDKGAIHASEARGITEKLGSYIGLAIDATQVSLAYSRRMDAALALDDADAQIDASYDARRLLVVDIYDKAAEAVFSSFPAAFATGFVMGLTGAAVVTAPALLIGVAVGFGGKILYERYKQQVRESVFESYTEMQPRETYREAVQAADGDPLALRNDSFGDDLIAMSGSAEFLVLSEGRDTISGTQAELNNDHVLSFEADDTVLVREASFNVDDVRVTQGSAILDIDVDNDGLFDLTLRLEGDFVGATFDVVPGVEGTAITLGTPAFLIEGDESSESLVGGSGDDTILGAGGNDTLSGGAGNDWIDGGPGDDLIHGATGDDILNGGAGADVMVGSDGGDLYYLDHPGDVVVERLEHTGVDRAFGTVSMNLRAAAVERMKLNGSADAVIVANDLDNLVIGNAGGNTLHGVGGNDTLRGEAGDDTLYGNAGDDVLGGGPGADIMNGGPGSDSYNVDDEGDRVAESYRWAGHDSVTASVDFRMGRQHIEDLTLTGTATLGAGNGLTNVIRGNGGTNILDGGKGVDTLIGGAGNDTYLVRSPGDMVIEAAGHGLADAVMAFRSYLLPEHVERLYLQSVLTQAGDAVQINGIGNTLDNVIIGNPYDNVISGREGNDTLRGQAGADTFVFDSAPGAGNVDRILDFNTNTADEGDSLLFRSALFDGIGAGGLAPSQFVAGDRALDANDRFVFDPGSGRLWYDADGSGGGAPTLLMTFDQGAVVTAEDIFFV